MSMSISRSLLWCSVFASVVGLSACSEKDPADVSYKDIDRSQIPTNVVTNSDLMDNNTSWPNWNTSVEATNGAAAEFTVQPGAPSGNSLKIKVLNVEAASTLSDIQAGPKAVAVKPGQGYGVGAFVKGPTCGLGKFVVHPTGQPDTILAVEELFFTGEWQAFDYYFQVPATGVTSVDLPLQVGSADNINSSVYIDKMVAIPTVTPKKSAAGNVAPNSDFEDSNTDINVKGSWGQSGTAATFTLDTTVAQSGKNSVKIQIATAGSGNPWDIEAGPVNVPTVSGWTYVFSAWVKGDAGAKANFLVQNPTQYNVFEQQAVTVTSEWQEVKFNVTVTGTNVVRLYAQYNFAENTNKTIYLDNIKLTPPKTCPYAPVISNQLSGNAKLFEYNHVANSSFEASNTNFPGWNTLAQGSAKALFTTQTVSAANRSLINSGSKSLKTAIESVGTNAWDIQAGPSDLLVIPGQTYIYSGFARGTPGTKANFTAALQGAPYTTFSENAVVFNNLWQQIIYELVVPANAPVLTKEELIAAKLPADALVSRVRMAVNMSYPENAGQSIFLDDFVLLPNAAENGDLENTASPAKGWSWQADNNLATFVLDTKQAHTGKQSLKATLGDMSTSPAVSSVQAGMADIPVVGGRKYYVSARVKGKANTKAKFVLDLAKAPYKEYGYADINLSADWQEVTFEANVPEGIDKVRLMAQLGDTNNKNAVIYLDSFKVVSQIPPPPKAKSANLVTNAGLENGNSAGWNGNNATLEVTTSAEGVYSGNHGLLVKERTSNWNSAQYSLLNAGLESGGHYLASAWVKVNGTVADNLKLTLQISYADGTPTQYISVASTGAADTLGWVKLSGLMNYAPVSAISDAKLYIEADGATTSYFIDDLFLTKLYSPNGNLELGNTNGWNAGGPAKIAATNVDKHAGNNALLVTDRTSNWNSAQYNLLNSGMRSGRTYQISAWVKIADASADNIKMTIEKVDGGATTYRYMTIAQSSDTLNWVKLSSTYTFAAVDDATTLKVYFEADSATSSYYIDDLVITEVIPPVNMISNGGVELGRTEGWNANNAKIEETRDPQGIYSGNFGLKVTERLSNWNSAQYSLLNAGLEVGGSYQASAWVKVNGTVADNLKMTLQIAYTDGTGTQYIPVASTGAADTLGWVKLSGLINSYAPLSTVSDVKLYIEADGATTSYYVDDLKVVKFYSPNGNLETGNTNGWNAGGPAKIAVTTADKHSGTNGLLVSDRTSNWNSAQFSLLSSGMLAGKTYDISAWVKIADATADTLKMTVEIQDEDNAKRQYQGIASASNTTEWVKLSSRYTYVPDGAASVFKVYFEANGATSSYYIDDLVITEAND